MKVTDTTALAQRLFPRRKLKATAIRATASATGFLVASLNCAAPTGGQAKLTGIRAIAIEFWGEDNSGVLMMIQSDGAIQDQEFIHRVRAGWISDDARQLSMLLRSASRGSSGLTVAGRNSEKVQIVVLQAFKLQRERNLEGGELLIIGDGLDQRKIVRAGKVKRLKVHIRPMRHESR